MNQKPYLPKAYEVRARYKNYLRLKDLYKQRTEANSFNKCAYGSKVYYERSLRRYEAYLQQWGHLINIKLDSNEK